MKMRFVIELSPHLFVCKSLPGNLITLLIYGGGRGLTGRSFQEIGGSVWTDEERGSSTVLPSRHQLHRMWCLVPAWHTVCLEGGTEWCWGCTKSSWVLGVRAVVHWNKALMLNEPFVLSFDAPKLKARIVHNAFFLFAVAVEALKGPHEALAK